ELGEPTLSRLATDAELQMALLATTATPTELREASRLLAAAILYRQLSGLVLRSERESAIRQLGPSAFEVAIREAPQLYPEVEKLTPPPAETEAEESEAGGEPMVLRGLA